MELSVIVATYNRKDLLLRVLEALRRQTIESNRFEVLVVDDGSTDGTSEALSNRPEVRVLSQPNRGPAAARNLAIRNARGTWVVMTDDDTIPCPTWLESVSEAIHLHPDWIGVEGRTLCPDPNPLGHWVENTRGKQYITANIAYRRDLLMELGGLDESFPHPKCEDTELAWRCLKKGPIGFWPAMEVVHPNREQPLSALLRSTRYELSEFRLSRKLGEDYGKFRRSSSPWFMLALIYLVVPWVRAWRFRSQLTGRQGLAYLFVHSIRPFWLGYYLLKEGGS
jgi:GT2 family glycosyltransferase